MLVLNGTGIVVALLGTELDSGKFDVEDHCVAGLPQQPSPPPLLTTFSEVMEADTGERHRYVSRREQCPYV